MNATGKKLAIIAFTFLFMLCSNAHANPVVISIDVPIYALAALFIEALVVSFLMKKYGFRSGRILLFWTLITFITFIVLMLGGMIIMSFLWSMIPRINAYIPTHIISIIFIEALIIWIEAKILMKISQHSCFCTDKNTLSMKTALSISAIANITSIIAGTLMLTEHI